MVCDGKDRVTSLGSFFSLVRSRIDHLPIERQIMNLGISGNLRVVYAAI